MAEQAFLYDDFFAGDDNGREVEVTVRGRKVPMTIKRGLSIADRAECEVKALKISYTDEGKPKFEGVNERVLMEEMLVRAVLKWPFRYGPNHPQAGEPVPVTRENILNLLGGGEEILKLLDEAEKAVSESLDPFAAPSAEV